MYKVLFVFHRLTKLEIPVRLISGRADEENHAWSLVQLNGEWVHYQKV